VFLQQVGELVCIRIEASSDEPGIEASVLFGHQELESFRSRVVVIETWDQGSVDEDSTIRILAMKDPTLASVLVLQKTNRSNSLAHPRFITWRAIIFVELREEMGLSTNFKENILVFFALPRHEVCLRMLLQNFGICVSLAPRSGRARRGSTRRASTLLGG